MSELFNLDVEDVPEAEIVSAQRSQSVSFASYECASWR